MLLFLSQRQFVSGPVDQLVDQLNLLISLSLAQLINWLWVIRQLDRPVVDWSVGRLVSQSVSH